MRYMRQWGRGETGEEQGMSTDVRDEPGPQACCLSPFSVARDNGRIHLRRTTSLVVRRWASLASHSVHNSNSYKLGRRRTGQECCTSTSLLLNTNIHTLYCEAQHEQRHERRRDSYRLLEMRRERYSVRKLKILFSAALL